MGNVKTDGISCVICGNEKTVGRKLCKSCYYKERRRGNLESYPHASLSDTFMFRVQKTESCWLWTGHRNDYGYGIVEVNAKKIRAHRFSYELFKGPILDGDLVVMHKCDNPACVNPDHLSLGTKLDNNRDAVKKRRNAYGERNGHARLSSEQIAFIRDSPIRQTELARMFGVNQSHISRIKCGAARSKG